MSTSTKMKTREVQTNRYVSRTILINGHALGPIDMGMEYGDVRFKKIKSIPQSNFIASPIEHKQ